MRYLPLSPGHLEATIDLAATALRLRASLAGPGSSPPRDPAGIARAALDPHLTDGDRFAYIALDDGGTVTALLAGAIARLSPRDEAYTYMAPRHAHVPLSTWCAHDPRSAVESLPPLLAAAREHLDAASIGRLNIQVLDGDWWSAGLWRSLGFRPDTVFALRPLDAPIHAPATGPRVRAATASDLGAVVPLCLEEHAFHAANTGSGVAPDQDRRTVERIAGNWLDHGAGEDRERAFVAVDEWDHPVGVTTAQVLTAPAGSSSAALLPARYAYLGLTSVTASARGTGAGTALMAHALEWARHLPDPPDAVGLHYVADNALSAPFWQRRGFAPALTLFTDAPTNLRSTTERKNSP
ncbi:GNAT family N-acetyltransferase [Occultella glacieicola]|uniref:GNAT family N-acetyltransferase n=1 Tax=Occultella glacieicola TaxID=2518684 RepID=A0ABY2DXB4_9MICO|nr:GNAT family N-acetyltransferase [Occultella glacieicola]TDE88779.1 GNAT family N-acetyltransferase [Occultella glacieicola]